MSINFVKELANRMRDPEEVYNQVFTSSDLLSDRPVPWNPLSLSHGYPGILFLFATLDSLYPEERWDQTAHLYVLKIKDTIESNGISDLSLFGGLAGCCLAIQYASRKKTRYQKLLNTLNSYLFQNLETVYFLPLQEKIDLNLPISPDLYDCISGICGIGILALQNLDCPVLFSKLSEILKICISLTKDIQIGPYKLPGWYVPRHYQFTEIDKQHYPKGNFNLGMAHGISGILAFLSIAVLHGIKIEGQIEAIEKIIQWISSKRQEKEGKVIWPYHVAFEEETLEIKQEIPVSITNAWCYGTPGVARALYLAGKVLKNIDIQKLATEAFLSIFQGMEIHNYFSTATFCHGVAGILTLTQLMARDTRSLQLKKYGRHLEKELLKFYNPAYPFGFKDREPLFSHQSILNSPFSSVDLESNKPLMIEVNKVGILEGVAGILLSLISLHEDNYDWTAPFLIEGI